MRKVIEFLGLNLAWLVFSGIGTADERYDWFEGTSSRADGATWEYFNREAYQRWKTPMGDWIDRQGVDNGGRGYATIEVETIGECSVDVTLLANEWIESAAENHGFFLKSRVGVVWFSSREDPNLDLQPKLLLRYRDSSKSVKPNADTYLSHSSTKGYGELSSICVSRDANGLIRFPLEELRSMGNVDQAVLVLNVVKKTSNKVVVDIFRTTTHQGYAKRMIPDGQSETLAGVVFKESFESSDWKEKWSKTEGMYQIIGNKDATDTGFVEWVKGSFTGSSNSKKIIPEIELGKFRPLSGAALCCWIPEGGQTALNFTWPTKRGVVGQATDLYLRYYIRLGDSWSPRIGGKLPGFAGRYGKAGWGGRRSSGDDGWSARGTFFPIISDKNPMKHRTPIGTYAYHKNQKMRYGDLWPWNMSAKSLVERNRWYCIEQHLRLNDVGCSNGIIEAWVDGELAYQKFDIEFRTVDRIGIEELWVNVYYGGEEKSTCNQYLFIDEIVVSKNPIGLLKPLQESIE